MPKIVGGGRPFPPEICVQSDAPPLKQHNFDQYRLIAPQPSYLAKKVQLAFIRSRPRAFQHAIDEPCTLPLCHPKGWHKNAISLFVPVKFNFCRKKSATKFLCMKTSSGKVVATSFPYPTVHRLIAGDVPVYLKLAFKVTHPFRKRRFPKLLFKSSSAVTAGTDTFCDRNLAQRI